MTTLCSNVWEHIYIIASYELISSLHYVLRVPPLIEKYFRCIIAMLLNHWVDSVIYMLWLEVILINVERGKRLR